MLAVVVVDVEVDGDFHFERQKTGTCRGLGYRVELIPPASSA
jgi:hypothetical protein